MHHGPAMPQRLEKSAISAVLTHGHGDHVVPLQFRQLGDRPGLRAGRGSPVTESRGTGRIREAVLVTVVARVAMIVTRDPHEDRRVRHARLRDHLEGRAESVDTTQLVHRVVFYERAGKAVTRVHDVHTARQHGSIGVIPVECTPANVILGNVGADGHGKHLEIRGPGNAEEPGIVGLRGHDARDRGAVRVPAIRLVIRSCLIQQVLEKRFRDTRPGEFVMGEIHTRIHDPDGDPVARPYILAIHIALHHGDGRMGLMYVECFQSPLAQITIGVRRTASKFRVRETIGGEVITQFFKFIHRDTSMRDGVNLHAGWWGRRRGRGLRW